MSCLIPDLVFALVLKILQKLNRGKLILPFAEMQYKIILEVHFWNSFQIQYFTGTVFSRISVTNYPKS